MVRNTEKFSQAMALRKRGFTLAEIAKYCAVSKSTVSKWLKNNAISAQVTKQNKRRAGQENSKRLRLISKARKSERQLRHAEALRHAETEFKHYKQNPLFLAGVSLYMAAGDRTNQHQIRLSSVRQDCHQVFIHFALEYLGVEKAQIRFWLLLYSTSNEEACMKKWKAKTGLSYDQFRKNQFVKSNSPRQPLHYGVGNTIIGSTVLKQKLNHWIELLIQELANT